MLDSEIFADFAGEFNWSDLGDWGGNIIAYRIPQLTEIKELLAEGNKVLSDMPWKP